MYKNKYRSLIKKGFYISHSSNRHWWKWHSPGGKVLLAANSRFDLILKICKP